MVRPIWYYSGYVTDAVKEGISAFGNPLVWWGGIPAFLYVLYLLVTHSSFLRALTGKAAASSATTPLSRREYHAAAFLVVGYLAQYLPWFFVTRITFIYHYFPSVPFVVLMIVYSLMQWKKHMSDRTFIIVCCAYAAVAFALFLLFYPVLSGQPVSLEFVENGLRWLTGWVLVL